MTPPPKSQTVGQIHAAKLRHEGTNQSLVLNYRDWMSGATSGRGRNIFLDILFIESTSRFLCGNFPILVVALRQGGPAPAKKLTAEQRQEKARKAHRLGE